MTYRVVHPVTAGSSRWDRGALLTLREAPQWMLNEWLHTGAIVAESEAAPPADSLELMPPAPRDGMPEVSPLMDAPPDDEPVAARYEVLLPFLNQGQRYEVDDRGRDAAATGSDGAGRNDPGAAARGRRRTSMSYAWTETELRKHGLKTDRELADGLREISDILRDGRPASTPVTTSAVRTKPEVWAEITAGAETRVQKSATPVTLERARVQVMEAQPELYEEWHTAPAGEVQKEVVVTNAEAARLAEIDRELKELGERWSQRTGKRAAYFISDDPRGKALYDERNRLTDALMRRRG